MTAHELIELAAKECEEMAGMNLCTREGLARGNQGRECAEALRALKSTIPDGVIVSRAILEILQWDDDVDNTAVSDGWVTCRICEGSGSYLKKNKCPPTHKPDCPVGHALAAAQEKP